MGASNNQLQQARSLLEGNLELEKESERRRHLGQQAKQMGDSILGSTRTPLEELHQRLAEVSAAEGAGAVDPLHAQIAKLQAHKAFAERQTALEGPVDNRRNQAGGALLQGSAAAFSASFGAKPVEKNIAELARLNQEILDVQRKIETKLGATHTIP
jgi:hypothetical protein